MKKKLTVYLAGPIDGLAINEAADWRKKLAKDLPDVEFLDPLRRIFTGYDYDKGQWFTGGEKSHAAEIVESDKEDVRNSDVVFVYHDRPSVGTSMEILYAFDHGVYILVVHATGKPLSPWIYYHADKIVDTIDGGIEHLKKLRSEWILDLNLTEEEKPEHDERSEI